MQRGWKRVVAVLSAVLLVSGCAASEDPDGAVEPIDAPASDADDAGGAEDADAAPELDAAPEVDDAAPAEDPAASPEVDISVVPDEITLEYVDAVLVELERLYAEAAEIAAADNDLTVEVADRISSIFGGDRASDAYAVFRAIAESDGQLLVDPDELSTRTYNSVSILDWSADCLWVETVGDQSGVYVDAPAPQPTFVLLRQMTSRPARNFNPTPWVYHAQRVGADAELREAKPCTA